MPYPNTVLIYLDIPDDFVAQAKYVCRFFSDSWGLRVETTQDPKKRISAHIVYSSSVKSFHVDKKITIPFDSSLYNPATACSASIIDGRQVWTRKGCSSDAVDLIAATFLLLTLADEQQIAMSSRDYLGKFLVKSLPEGRQATIDVPLADYHAALLLDRILETAPALREVILPRWPEGKRFAVCLTHDTDSIHPGHPRELYTNIAKGLLRRKRVFLDMALEGLKHLRSPMDSVYWGFPGWMNYENEHKIRSCFYLPVSPRKCGRRLNDCKSDVFSAGVDWQVFRDMRTRGWEFGLHPAINAQKDVEEIILEKHALEERLGAPVMGLRHHYLAIDNLNPSQTFRKHAEAGFLYDTSLGWHDKAGFRAATSIPFRPYDSVLKTAIDLTEISLNLMDTYVMDEEHSKAVYMANAIVSTIKDTGGAITFNWHTETFCNQHIFLNYRTVVQSVLGEIFVDPGAWFATPLEIVKWWNLRRDILQDVKREKVGQYDMGR
jgi:hypothetical protein